MSQLQRLRGAIKGAQQKLSMDDDVYKSLLKRLTGKTSSTKLNFQQCKDVLEEMNRFGLPKQQKPNEALIRRITYLWLCLKDAGVITSKSRDAMFNYCQKFTDGKRLDQSPEKVLHGIIEGLKKWCDREKVNYKTRGA